MFATNCITNTMTVFLINHEIYFPHFPKIHSGFVDLIKHQKANVSELKVRQSNMRHLGTVQCPSPKRVPENSNKLNYHRKNSINLTVI